MKKLVFIKSTLTLSLTLLILAACSSNNSEKKNTAAPVKIEFFETYSMQDIQNNWKQAIELLNANGAPEGAEQDTTVAVSNENQAQASLNSLMLYSGGYNIGYVKEENIATVDAMLNRPEILDLFPPDLKFMWSYKPEDKAITGDDTYYMLHAIKVPEKRGVTLSGKHISDATVSKDQASGRVSIELSMTEKGSELWAEMTANNIERCIAMTLDGKVLFAPRVMNTITGGNTQLSGSFTVQEAEEIAAGIMAGR